MSEQSNGLESLVVVVVDVSGGGGEEIFAGDEMTD